MTITEFGNYNSIRKIEFYDSNSAWLSTQFYCGTLDSGLIDFIEYKYIYHPERGDILNKIDLPSLLPQNSSDIGSFDIPEEEAEKLNYIFPTESSGNIDYNLFFGSIDKVEQKLYIIRVAGKVKIMKLYNEKLEHFGTIEFSPFSDRDGYFSSRLLLIIQTPTELSVENLGYDLWIYRSLGSEQNKKNYDVAMNDLGPESILYNPKNTDIMFDATSDTLLGLRKSTSSPILDMKKVLYMKSTWKPWFVYKKGEKVEYNGEEWISLDDNNNETPDYSSKWVLSSRAKNPLNYRILVSTSPYNASKIEPSGYITMEQGEKVRIEVSEYTAYIFSGLYSAGQKLIEGVDYISGIEEKSGNRYYIVNTPPSANLIFRYTENPDIHVTREYTVIKNHVAESYTTSHDIEVPREYSVSRILAVYTLPDDSEREENIDTSEPVRYLDEYDPGFAYISVSMRIVLVGRVCTVILETPDEFIVDAPIQYIQYGGDVTFRLYSPTGRVPQLQATSATLSGPDSEGIYTVSATRIMNDNLTIKVV